MDRGQTLNDGQFDKGKRKDKMVGGQCSGWAVSIMRGGISLTRKGVTGVPVELHKTTCGYQDTLFDSEDKRGVEK